MTANELTSIQPEGWKAAKGYSNGVLVPAGWRTLHVAGQIAWTADQELVVGGFLEQFEQALANVVAVVRAAGGESGHVCRMTVYVTDKQKYLACTRDLGDVWKRHMGRAYPAMALVEVADLLEEGALVEIEATAAFP